MSIESIPKTANKTEQLQKNTDVKSNHISVEHSAGSSIFSPPTASALSSLNGKPSQSESTQPTVAAVVVKMLEDLGVRRAFGVSGGAIAPVWATLTHSSIEVLHFRHESGAAFAAGEAYFANGQPVVVFTTTGPGITNALTGLMAARWEGAKVIFLSAATAAPQRGRWGCQETSAYTMPMSGIFTSGPLFHYATTLESDTELPEIARRLANGLARPGSFVAHISIPTGIQTSPSKVSVPQINLAQTVATATEEAIAECVQLLSEGPFAIWVGFGARDAAQEIRLLAKKTGAAVMCSPRGKGIFPEDHPQFVGVTGVGGNEEVLTYMQEQPPLHTLVLGTRLSEPTSFWSPAMVPSRGFVHVDIDPEVAGVAYPSAETFFIQSEVGMFVKALLKQFPERLGRLSSLSLPHPCRQVINPGTGSPVRPEVLMDAIQRVIVEGSDAPVMAESGNSLSWGNHTLRFAKPGRYRVSTGFGSMGHFVTGVVGAALARNGKAVALVGDGAMLMNSEVSTAAKYQIPAVWIVLNDGGYNMCKQGMALLGFKGIDAEMPQADFVKIARGMGADGIRVETESDVEAALEKAMASPVPFVVDVVIDANQPAPIGGRIKSLISQGAKESKGDLS
jgi:acetolactate synthase-1/2/3 large subunit